MSWKALVINDQNGRTNYVYLQGRKKSKLSLAFDEVLPDLHFSGVICSCFYNDNLETYVRQKFEVNNGKLIDSVIKSDTEINDKLLCLFKLAKCYNVYNNEIRIRNALEKFGYSHDEIETLLVTIAYKPELDGYITAKHLADKNFLDNLFKDKEK